MSVDWSGLRAELAIWRGEARPLPLWWRDDDAVTVTPALERLARVSEQVGMPVHLAVIPAHLQSDLAPFVAGAGVFRPVVHGWRHDNHAPEGMKSSEFGTPRAEALPDAARGYARLAHVFRDDLLPMFVPPWNRIDTNLVPHLPGAGYASVSTYGGRAARLAAPGLVQINTHLDPVAWRTTRSLVPPEDLLAHLVKHLQERRAGTADAAEPLGLLTHHLMQDDPVWAFSAAVLEELLAAGHVADLAALMKEET